MKIFGLTDSDDIKFLTKIAVILGSTFVITFLVWRFMGEYPLRRFPPQAGENHVSASAGTYGDSFGYVNSLLSSLALAGAIAAVILQSMELRSQRKELKHSQRTWEEQARAAAAQSETMKAQTRVMHEQMLVQQLQNDLAILQAKTSAYQLTESKHLLDEIDKVQNQVNSRRIQENIKTRLRAQTAIGFGRQIILKEDVSEIGKFISDVEAFLERVAYDMTHSSIAHQIDVMLERLRVVSAWKSETAKDFERILNLIEMIDKQLPGKSPREEIKKIRGKSV